MRRTAGATAAQWRTGLVSVAVAVAVTTGTGGAIGAAMGGPAAAYAATAVTIDGTKGGRVFDGIGAISGGGGNSRLLIDYPEPYRSQILDYLFKPGYGASLQILKVEIGGDANSTDGSEASFQHTKGAVDCNAGYEWWLMSEAKARNPAIKLYGLAWAAPGWIGGGNFWSTDMVDYLVSWLDCAHTAHGLNIDYLGGWNERGYDITWYENLRSALNDHGYAGVKVVGADSGWEVATDVATDPSFAAAVDIIGAHYPCGGDGGDATSCTTTSEALGTGKPLWASENGSQDENSGTPALIRSITRGYIDAKMTSYINWPLLAAIYPNLPYATVGLMTAPQPWSGAYTVGKSTWATAQVTQFTQPGWRFIDPASGYLGGNRTNGSYVTLRSPIGPDWTTVAETTTATSAHTVSFTVTGGLSTGAVHVWSTNLDGAGDFQHTTDVTPTGGGFSVTLQPGRVYTLSTTTGQGKGTAAAPAPAGLTLPYNDDFDADATGSQARYLSDMQGSYEVQPCAGGRAGQCVQQMAPIRPIEWQDDSDAFSLVGDVGWTNYTVGVDVLLSQAGTVEVLGRANDQSRPQGDQNAYWLRVSDTGAWSVVRSDTGGHYTTLASGTTTAPGVGQWHHLSLGFQGTTITAGLDGTTIRTLTDAAYTSGQAGIGVVGYQTDQFDNLTVTPGTGGGGTPTGPVTSGIAGKCLDAARGDASNGAAVQLWDCDASAGQQWTVDNGSLRILGKCADVTGQNTANGTPVELWDCNGGANQQWAPQPDGTLRGVQSGRCLDDPGFATANGTHLEIWDCNAGANQRWNLPG